MIVRGHRAFTRDPGSAQLLGHPQHAHRHAEFRDRVGHVRCEPFRLHVERRRKRQDVRVRTPRFKIGRAGLGDQKRAARVDRLHQVVTLHLGRSRGGERDRRRVVDADVDPAEARVRSPRRRRCTCSSEADVAHERKGLAARGFDLGGRRVDRSGQSWDGAPRSWPRWPRWRRRARRAAQSPGRCRETRP